MLVCWPPHVSAPIHGHEGEKCWARVQTGELKICNYVEINRNPLSLEKIQEFDENSDFQVWKLTKVNFVDTKLENEG